MSKKKITKATAIKECFKMWLALAFSGAFSKPATEFESDCPLCEYCLDIKTGQCNCDMCPLLPLWGEPDKVGVNTSLCLRGKQSPFNDWLNCKSKKKNKEYAMKIATFCRTIFKNLYGEDILDNIEDDTWTC